MVTSAPRVGPAPDPNPPDPASHWLACWENAADLCAGPGVSSAEACPRTPADGEERAGPLTVVREEGGGPRSAGRRSTLLAAAGLIHTRRTEAAAPQVCVHFRGSSWVSLSMERNVKLVVLFCPWLRAEESSLDP